MSEEKSALYQERDMNPQDRKLADNKQPNAPEKLQSPTLSPGGQFCASFPEEWPHLVHQSMYQATGIVHITYW